jgi:hypothetical protein
MLIHERSVTKTYEERIHRLITRALKSKFIQLTDDRGEVSGVLRTAVSKHRRTYVVATIENGVMHPFAWLYLWRKPGWYAWEVVQVFVHEELRGAGYATLLYRTAIEIDGVTIASGESQSKFSRALWKSFVRNKTFDIYAIDYWNLKDRSQVFIEDDEVWCTLDIYETARTQRRDVRLIATKRP